MLILTTDVINNISHIQTLSINNIEIGLYLFYEAAFFTYPKHKQIAFNTFNSVKSVKLKLNRPKEKQTKVIIWHGSINHTSLLSLLEAPLYDGLLANITPSLVHDIQKKTLFRVMDTYFIDATDNHIATIIENYFITKPLFCSCEFLTTSIDNLPHFQIC